MNRGAFVLSAAVMPLAPRIGDAQAVSVHDAIARLFTAPGVQPDWFSAGFLAAVPLENVRSILTDLLSTLGPFAASAPNGARYTVIFTRGTIQAQGTLDATGAFTGLLFSRMQGGLATERIAALFRTDPIPAAWFSDRFLASVPIQRSNAIIAAMKTQLGAFVGITPAQDGSYDLQFANGTAHALIYLGADGKIEGLIFQP